MEDEWYTRICLNICLATILFFFVLEVIQMYVLKFDYLKNLWNLFDIALFSFFFTLYGYKFHKLRHSTETDANPTLMMIMETFITLFVFAKI